MTRFPAWLFSLAVVLTFSLQTTAAQQVLDATLYVSLALPRNPFTPCPPTGCPYEVIAVSPAGVRRLTVPPPYTLRRTFAPSGGYRSHLMAVDTNSMTAFGVAELPPLLAQFMTLVPRPSPPTNVTASVSGRSVQLSWTPGARGIPWRYVVSVGSAPGLADLAVFDVEARTSVNFAPVPAGRYFVRVQAGNADGLGVASSSATVIVP